MRRCQWRCLCHLCTNHTRGERVASYILIHKSWGETSRKKHLCPGTTVHYSNYCSMHASAVRLEISRSQQYQLSCAPHCAQSASAIRYDPSPFCRHVRYDAAGAWLGRSHEKHARTKLPLISSTCSTFLHAARVSRGLWPSNLE